MASQYRRKRRLKTSFKFLFILLFLILTVLAGRKIYSLYFAARVVVANVVPPPHSAASLSTPTKSMGLLDNWDYSDGNIAIKISKVQEYSGKDTVTMFVADVKLSSAGLLRTAFAKNDYGFHIIQKKSVIAKNNNALFAINGDYYGYRNNGIIVRNGVLYRDNPSWDMLAFFKGGKMSIIDEKTANVKNLLSAGLLDSFSFGPALIKDGKTGDFSAVFRDQWFIQNLEPRTGIGYISPNHFIFIVVDGRKDYYSRGLTLTEFAQEFAARGCTDAYNLDGGGSSTMYFNGHVVNDPLGRGGVYERSVSDIIYIPMPG